MSANVVHVEIPTDNLERARKFYSELFGWDLQETPGFGNYLMVQGEEGSMASGVAMMERPQGVSGLVVYFGVASVDDAIARVKELGGTVLAPRMPVAGMGWLAQFLDTEGNLFAVWQPDPAAR